MPERTIANKTTSAFMRSSSSPEPCPSRLWVYREKKSMLTRPAFGRRRVGRRQQRTGRPLHAPNDFEEAPPPENEGVLAPAAIDLDIEVPDLLAQRVAVQAQQVGRADLVAAGRGERGRQQRHLDLLQDAMIEARRRQVVGETREVRGQIGFDRAAEILDAVRAAAA